MHFLAFIPDIKPADLESAAKVAGLTDLISDSTQDVAANANGPNQLTGVMLGWLSPTNPHIHFDAAKQTWLPSIVKDDAGKPRYWIGIWTASVPHESEMRRAYTQDGTRTRLGEQTWKLPTPSTVDSRAVYNDDGSMRWEVIRKFSWVCDEAKSMTAVYLENFGLRNMLFAVDPGEQVEWLLKLLRINYRMTPEVAAYLDLWVGKKNVIDVVLSTLGLFRKTEVES